MSDLSIVCNCGFATCALCLGRVDEAAFVLARNAIAEFDHETAIRGLEGIVWEAETVRTKEIAASAAALVRCWAADREVRIASRRRKGSRR